jgi:hypothetical protein
LEETEKATAGYKRAQLGEGVHRPLFGLFVSGTIFLACGTVFRRKLLPAILPDDAGSAYDLWLTYLLCKNGLGAFYISDRLSSYRVHADNLTKSLGLDDWLPFARCWYEVSCDRNFALVGSSNCKAQRLAGVCTMCSGFVPGRSALGFVLVRGAIVENVAFVPGDGCMLPPSRPTERCPPLVAA